MGEVHAMTELCVRAGLAGRYKLVVRDAETMEVTKETDWFDNLILDNGLNTLTTQGVGSTCCVGTGNTAPNVLQTTLVALVGSTTNNQENTIGCTATSPYYTWIRRRMRFAAGTATGNLSEVGIGASATNLFSRALIVDGGGSPTTITVLSTEVLDVWYELRVYWNESDVNFQLQIGPTLHDCVLRPTLINTVQIAGGPGANDFMLPWNSTIFCSATATDGAVGSITGGPSGASYGAIGKTILAYVNNSYHRDITFTWGLNEGNAAGGLDACTFASQAGKFQVGFTPPIPKVDTKQLTLTFRWSWARHTP